jgi:hypothetical protein
MKDPISELVRHVMRDGKPPISWVVEWAPAGDFSRAWRVSEFPRSMLAVLFQARSPMIAPGVRAVLELYDHDARWRDQLLRRADRASLGLPSPGQRLPTSLQNYLDASERYDPPGAWRQCNEIRVAVPIPPPLSEVIANCRRHGVDVQSGDALDDLASLLGVSRR